MYRKKPFHYRSPGNAVKQSILEPFGWTAAMVTEKYDLKTLIIALASIVAGCSTMAENPRKNIQLGLITTPPAYYTTQKARYLGEKYKNNLDRLIERIVRDPKTANLQFANNIASVGGIGFFTHSATSSVDERFLEIIIGVPDTFDAKIDHNAKVHQLFSLYGTELLSILASDSDIYQEREVSGYGLNLSWRNLVSDAAGTRISLERATLYFNKGRVQSFLRGDVNQNILLGEAVIFAVVDDGPMKLVSYRPQESTPDLRRPIQEEALLGKGNPAKTEAQAEKADPLVPAAKRSTSANEQVNSSTHSLSQANEKMAELKAPPVVEEKLNDRREAILAPDKTTEAPVPSATSAEQSKSMELSSVARIEEGMAAAKPELAVPASLAAPEHVTTESQYVSQKADLGSLPVAPAVAPIAEPHQTTMLPKEQLKEQPLLESQQAKATPVERSAALPLPKVLQGFVIQLAFGEIRDAQRWAETLERRGFAVSLTEAAGGESVRVRIGNFGGREEAEHQLQTLRQEGLKGIVLNLPQAYQPGVYRTVPEKSGDTLSAVQ
jgi:DedD protein